MDRMWTPFNFEGWNIVNSSHTFQPNYYDPPGVVMSTAVAPRNENVSSVSIYWTTDDQRTEDFYIYLHFAELEKLEKNETREMNIYLNDTLFYGPVVPNYLSLTTIYSTQPKRGSTLQVMVNRTENSTLPPLLNAMEIYTVKYFEYSETDQNDGI